MAGRSGTLTESERNGGQTYRHFRELHVWQLARLLATDVYRLTATFPPSEQFGLTSQLRRAAISISSNIAEGHGRRLDGAFVQFLRIAIGSTNEVESLLVIASDLEMISKEQSTRLEDDCTKLAVKLSNFIQALSKPGVRETEAEYLIPD